MLEKREIEKLRDVLFKYIDMRICEIVNPTGTTRDPSETTALLWHKFETLYMNDYSGTTAPISHKLFREFLHWLDDACDELERVLKGYCNTKIDEKFATIKLANDIVLIKREDGHWGVELRDQFNDILGTQITLPDLITVTPDSGLKLTLNVATAQYQLTINQDGIDSSVRRYVKTDNNGLYIDNDTLTPIATNGWPIAKWHRASDDKDIDILGAVPFVPTTEATTTGANKKLIGEMGTGEKVYSEDTDCTEEGHYQPTFGQTEGTSVLSGTTAIEEGQRVVITDIFIDSKGHFVGGKYALINEDGTIDDEDQDIENPLPEPDEPEEPETTTYSGRITLKVKNIPSASWSKEYSNVAANGVVNFSEQYDAFREWLATNSYQVKSWTNGLFAQRYVTITPTTPSELVYEVDVETAVIKVRISYLYDNKVVDTKIVTGNVLDLPYGTIFDPYSIQFIDQEVDEWYHDQNNIYNGYTYESHSVVASDDTNVNIILTKANSSSGTPSTPGTNPALVTYQDLQGSNVENIVATPPSNNTVKDYLLPGITDTSFPVCVEVQANYDDERNTIENYVISIQVQRGEFLKFGTSNIELYAVMSNGKSYQIDYSNKDFDEMRNARFVTTAKDYATLTSINVRYSMVNIQLKN